MKEDSGDWTVEITNDSGTCNVNFPLTIRATPGACRAPIKVSDTTFSTARLTWAPPSDDGGAKVTHYVVEKKEVGKSYWTTVTSQVCLVRLIVTFQKILHHSNQCVKLRALETAVYVVHDW